MLGLLFVIVVLFFREPVPLYVLALGIPVILVVFEPITKVSAPEVLSGFSSEAAEYLPALGALGLFYLATAVITNLIHKNASEVLAIPIAALRPLLK